MREHPICTPSEPRPQHEPFGRELVALLPRLRAFLRNLQRGDGAPLPVDDLAQEALARAWRSRAAFDPARGKVDAWLLRIAFRAFLDHRAAPPTEPLADDRAAAAPGPAATAATREHCERLLALLDERERHALLRFHRDGRSIAQIAAETGAPIGTVKSHLHRARAKLWAHSEDGAP
jgi:RNA polymerase sigma-70 factor (ECF subfamily)